MKILKSIVFVLLANSFFNTTIYAQSSQNIGSFSWNGTIESKVNGESIPMATIRVFSNGRTLVFVADENGKMNLFYIHPTEQDSLTVSAIGYYPKNLKISNLPAEKIVLQTKFISLKEIRVHPNKFKNVKLGNKSLFVADDTNGNFGGQKVLYIKNKGIKGRVHTIRYRMVEFKGDFFRPFRVRLYAKDTLNQTVGTDLLNTNLIISRNKGRWVEVDVSAYNIDFPANGLFVGYEILSKEYYLSKNIIKQDKVGDINALNNVFIQASSHSNRSERLFETWEYISSAQGWIRSLCTEVDPIINIIVEAEQPRKNKQK